MNSDFVSTRRVQAATHGLEARGSDMFSRKAPSQALHLRGFAAVTLALDWEGLGLSPATVTVTAPAVAGGVQPHNASFPSATGPFHVPAGQGLLLLLTDPAFHA